MSATRDEAIRFVVGIGVILTLLLVGLCGCNAPTSETVKVLDQALDSLERHGVYYEAELSGQTEGEVWFRQSAGGGTPGFLSVRFRSPHQNPLTNANSNGS